MDQYLQQQSTLDMVELKQNNQLQIKKKYSKKSKTEKGEKGEKVKPEKQKDEFGIEQQGDSDSKVHKKKKEKVVESLLCAVCNQSETDVKCKSCRIKYHYNCIPKEE